MTKVCINTVVDVDELSDELARQLDYDQLLYLIERIDYNVGNWGFTRRLALRSIRAMRPSHKEIPGVFNSFVKTVAELLKIDKQDDRGE